MVWIDAICVDQENPDECGHQVQLMPEIYSQAKRVLIYPGEPTGEDCEDIENGKSIDATDPPRGLAVGSLLAPHSHLSSSERDAVGLKLSVDESVTFGSSLSQVVLSAYILLLTGNSWCKQTLTELEDMCRAMGLPRSESRCFTLLQSNPSHGTQIYHDAHDCKRNSPNIRDAESNSYSPFFMLSAGRKSGFHGFCIRKSRTPLRRRDQNLYEKTREMFMKTKCL
ncbi:hypothetical protein B0T25DRAFT_270371 [Lasiosphaeria hispida]|uniref:Heterokaryon incompatibility domain-containing protein n=1 Tax=Lasiosphaeria hispida TaxID=260671 RepID=A0AAJ0HBH2_9PEZI|nr:hypothetical protein B0T25DRAFT_270371 [Lasiosphaeria hispida]